MMFYHNTYVPKKQFNEAKLFCACLICGKGKYKGGHGSVHDFLRIHRTSECVKQWDSVAHLFGELPEGVAPAEPPAPQVSPQEAMKDRRIAQLLAVIAEWEAGDAASSKRYNEMYKENEAMRKEITDLRRQLLEAQVARGIEDTPAPPAAPPPAVYDFDAVAPGVPLPPAADAVKTEVAEPPPTLITVPAEPDPDAPVPPGYFRAKSGKIIKAVKKAAPAPPAVIEDTPAPPAPPAPKPYANLPNPIVRNPGGVKTPMMIQVVPQAKAKPAPLPRLLNPDDFLAKTLAEAEAMIGAPLSAEQEAEEAQAKADMIKETIDTITFELLEKIRIYRWDGGRIGRYIDKLQAENKDIKLFDVLMSGDCSAITRYVEGDKSKECLGEIEDLYEARR
jgi:hypothetical protein